MNENTLTAGIIIGIIVSFLITTYINTNYSHSNALKYGCGEYNTSTGDFQWKDYVESK
jgi:hypothetical protein